MGLWLADAVAGVHGAVVLGVVGGALLAVLGALRRWPKWERAYFGLLLLVAAANLLWGDCPLTEWERALRAAYRPDTGYTNSFLGHYLPWLPSHVLAWLGPAVMVGGLLAGPAWRWADGKGRGSLPRLPRPSR